MGVYIKDMKKPKSCDQCPIFLWALPKDCYLEIGMCPITEIKTPHGRLIDTDEVEAQVELMQKVNGKDRGFMDIALAFAVASTVIESEDN